MYSAYDALIFDMDGTLIDSMPLHDIAWRKTLDFIGLPVIPQLMRQLVGVPTAGTLQAIARHSGLTISARQIADASGYKDQLVENLVNQGLPVTPVTDIARRWYGIKPLAVGTGAHTEEALRMLEMAGIAELFSVVIGADQVAQPKPAPDTFIRAAEQLGVDPQRCVVFEDGDPGLDAARAGGMTAVDVRQGFGFINHYFID